MTDSVPVYIHLLRAKDLIDRSYAQALDVEGLARAAHTSPAHFSRSFKRAFGETPHKYLQRRRIERAKELLRESELVGEPPIEYARRWRAGRPPPIPGCFTLMYTRPVEPSSFREAPDRSQG